MNTTEYRQPTHREELERELVHGASSQIAHAPENAAAIAKGIKTVLDELAPVAPHPVAIAPLPAIDPGPNSHAAAVLYPAIERAMGELSKLHEGFNMEANRAFNILHDAFWSECPAPASAVPKRRETADVEHRPKPHSLEREIQAKADKVPRVTPSDIEANIASEHYFTARDGRLGALTNGAYVGKERPVEGNADLAPLDLLTFCVLVLRNGFTVTGESACASPENFDADVGRKIARQNAINKVWPLLGFRLRDELTRTVLTDADAAADLAGTPRPDNPTAEAADFLASVKACDFSGDAPCEACQ